MKYPMHPDEYRAAIEALGLPQGRAAWLFNGKSDRTGRRWVEQGAPFHVALILQLMQQLNLTPEYIDMLGRAYRPARRKDDQPETETESNDANDELLPAERRDA